MNDELTSTDGPILLYDANEYKHKIEVHFERKPTWLTLGMIPNAPESPC